ncbi:hypothetical protein D4764_07G0009330 [Takifugu flavidus]|uniref:Uncharacterized protein n=1 Tax=Takifugu flavidus TaxID=433684 RepID=A0A5C6MSC8_9TELE|nr:hypothetical protein D4764_07G0009330 [Takifugu flavidus]
MSAVQIWRRRGGVVSSSLHKPSAADREVVRGGPRENVVGLGEGIVDHGPGLPVSRLIAAE